MSSVLLLSKCHKVQYQLLTSTTVKHSAIIFVMYRITENIQFSNLSCTSQATVRQLAYLLRRPRGFCSMIRMRRPLISVSSNLAITFFMSPRVANSTILQNNSPMSRREQRLVHAEIIVATNLCSFYATKVCKFQCHSSILC